MHVVVPSANSTRLLEQLLLFVMLFILLSRLRDAGWTCPAKTLFPRLGFDGHLELQSQPKQRQQQALHRMRSIVEPGKKIDALISDTSMVSIDLKPVAIAVSRYARVGRKTRRSTSRGGNMCCVDKRMTIQTLDAKAL